MTFKKEKYLVIKNAISEELADFCYDYFNQKKAVARVLFDEKYISQLNSDWGVWNDIQVPNTYSHYGDIVMETLLQKLKPLMEKETKLKLNETYSYARIYKKGDELKRHKDRYSCEVSTTLHLGGDQWSIFLEGKEVKLEVGDMLIYSGCELEHWREPFFGENCGQVFLHYNDADQETAEKNKFDGRPILGLPSWFKGYNKSNG